MCKTAMFQNWKLIALNWRKICFIAGDQTTEITFCCSSFSLMNNVNAASKMIYVLVIACWPQVVRSGSDWYVHIRIIHVIIFLKFHLEHRALSNNTELKTLNLGTVNDVLVHPILCELKFDDARMLVLVCVKLLVCQLCLRRSVCKCVYH